ncbi:MAG: amidohydrolase family protein [Balneola sp.]
MKPITSLILSVLFLLNCQGPQSADLIITDATIVDVINNSVIPNQLIAVSGDKIIATDDISNLGNYTSEKIISVEGRFVMPGLWDNHTHFRGGEDLVQENKDFLSLFLAYGITTVRDAGGDITPSLQEWEQMIAENKLAGPTIFTPGPKLDGEEPAWEGSISVTNSTEVSDALDSLEAIKADYVKMYDGSLSKDSFYDIIEQAEARGFKTTGHMPLTANLMRAVELGLDGTEHLYYPLTEGSPLGDSLIKAGVGYGMITPLMDSYDDELAKQAYATLAESEFYVTPTLHVGKTLAELLVVDHSEDSLLDYISPKIVDTYQRRINLAERGGESYTNMRAQWVTSFSNMVKPMYDAGIYILAGSDSGPFNSYTYPGESIHSELALLVNAGLTPQEALITSVVYGPKFFGLESEYGSIESDKIADLLILNNNPLEDISNTTSIFGVIADGNWNSKSDLQELMNEIKN